VLEVRYDGTLGHVESDGDLPAGLAVCYQTSHLPLAVRERRVLSAAPA
jgi:hypothetical protein